MLNAEEFEKLRIYVNLLEQQKNTIILELKDSGPGLNHSEMTELLTGQETDIYKQKKLEPNMSPLNFLKYATFKLAKHCLVISRTKQVKKQQSIMAKDSISEEVHVGMLSSEFIRHSCSPYMVAPVVSYVVQTLQINGKTIKELIPSTPLASHFISLILQYTGIFEDEEDLKNHVLTISCLDGKFLTGTSIYLSDLQYDFHICENDIILESEIHQYQNMNKMDSQFSLNPTQLEELLSNIETSLFTMLQYAYIDFP